MPRIGIDIVEVSQVEASIATFGERYLQRIYTAREARDTQGSPARLAARFAAKEATLKVLDSPDRGVDLRSIEVVKLASGRPTLLLTGVAKELALSAGLGELEVSLSHDGSYATAVVLAGEPASISLRAKSALHRRSRRLRKARCR